MIRLLMLTRCLAFPLEASDKHHEIPNYSHQDKVPKKPLGFVQKLKALIRGQEAKPVLPHTTKQDSSYGSFAPSYTPPATQK